MAIDWLKVQFMAADSTVYHALMVSQAAPKEVVILRLSVV